MRSLSPFAIIVAFLALWSPCSGAEAPSPSVPPPSERAENPEGQGGVPLRASVSPDPAADTVFVSLEAPSPADWVTFDRLDLALAIPGDSPTNCQALAQVEDWDGLWYQCLLPDTLPPGATTSLSVDVSSGAAGWGPLGHPGAWHRRSLMQPRMVRLCLFANGAAVTSAVEVASASAVRSSDTSPPTIRDVREAGFASGAPAPGPLCVFGRYELRFDLPDRYSNPFDPEEIVVDAEILTPSGAVVTMPCFYYQNCVRELAAASERILPQGRPEWRLRYSPAEVGLHTVSLVARDRFGTNRLDSAAVFTASPSRPEQAGASSAGPLSPIRVSSSAPHFFEDVTGVPYYPIGFNIRSPFDSRMDQRFPNRFRHLEGTLSYARRFAAMRESGITFAEIWSSAWCMGLEWVPKFPGYHGIGQLNLLNAWDRDRVFEMAAANAIRVNLVLNNHGRLSSFCDPEWEDNPWNAANGGPFQNPMEWFSDERAQRGFEAILRYEIARNSWNANLFAWELWSELDLVGDGHIFAPREPAVLAWHARMAAYLRAHDPMRHLISTHTCTDYTRMAPELAGTPGLDHVCVDAYHTQADPLYVVELLAKTGQEPHLSVRPCLVTEFGGTPNAAGIGHLRRELHAALWSSLPCGLSGVPAFWWWHVVEECDFYPLYAAFARFVADEDMREPAFLRTGDIAELSPPDSSHPDSRAPSRVEPHPDSRAPSRVEQAGASPAGPVFRVLSLSRDRAYGWVYVGGPAYVRADPAGPAVFEGYRLSLDVPEWEGAVFTVEFWDTLRGQSVRRIDIRVREGHFDVPIPSFARDIAFRIHRKAP